MSRIGNLPINIPSGVDVSINDNLVLVKGSKGELKQKISPTIKIIMDDNLIQLSRENDSKDTKSKHGLSRALINNMVIGVSKGYKIILELVGVGYRANAQGQKLELSLGFSHNVVFSLAKEIKVTTVTERGKNPLIILESHDKQLLGQVVAKIRSLRKPEPYKGKGIRIQGEQVRRKAGKSASKK